MGPPPDDFMSLVEESAVEEIFEGPPDAFDEALVVGDVGLAEIDPKADAFGESFPFLHVSPDALLALLDEGFDTESFDFVFAMDTEFFADFDFDGESVGIPAGFAQAMEAAHGSVAGEEIFDGAG